VLLRDAAAQGESGLRRIETVRELFDLEAPAEDAEDREGGKEARDPHNES